MGFTIAIHSPLKALQDYIFRCLLKGIFQEKSPQTLSDHIDHGDGNISYPSLVPLPPHLINKSIKDHLPIDDYIVIKSPSRSRAHDVDVEEEEEDDDDCCCVVCLNSIETLHKVRKLGNCEHLFHVECIDGWIDEDQETCPVCRARLWTQDLEHGVKDPWRSQRMIYLFGEDLVMGDWTL